jgi:hypothetical protein
MGVAGGQGVDAGWYDDHRTAGVVRWYDGTAWTEHTRPEPNPFAPPGGAAPHGTATTTYAPAPPVTFAPAEQPAYSAAPTYAPGEMAPFGAGAAYSPVPTHAPGQAAPYAGAGTMQSPFGSYGEQAPAWGQPFTGSPFGGPSYPGVLVDQGAIDALRRRVLRDFGLGVGFLLLGALIAFWVTATLSSAGGYGGGRHYVSTAGVVSGLLSFYRARKNYKSMLAMGGAPWSSARMTSAAVVASVAVLLSTIAIVHAYTATGSAGTGPAVAGSCWAGGNGTVWQVSCGAPHSYQATAVIMDGEVCPNSTDMVVSSGDQAGSALCLAPSSGPAPQ